jgi:hypothetical protein
MMLEVEVTSGGTRYPHDAKEGELEKVKLLRGKPNRSCV